MATDQYQVAAQANRIRVVPVEAPRGRILDRNGKVLVDNRISVQVTIDRTVLDELEDDERTRRPHRAGRGARPRQQARRPSRTSRPTWPTSATARTCRCPSPATCPRSSRSGSTSTPRSFPASRPSASPCAATPTASSPPTCSATRARSSTRSSRRRPARRSRTRSTTRSGSTASRRSTRTTSAARPARGRSRSTPRTSRSASSTRTPPVPGDDLVLNLDIDVQAQAEQALQSGLAIAKDRPCTGCQSTPKAEKGSTVVLDPKTGGVIAMASYPTFNPADFVDGISDIEWAALTAEENNTPLNNWAIQGQYAPGSTFKLFTAVAGPRVRADHARHHRLRRRRVRGARLQRRLVRLQQRPAARPYGVVDLRRSLTVSSDFYYYGLGAQFWIQQDRLGGPETYADLLKQWGFDSDTGIDLSSEQAGRIPSPAWLADYCADVGLRRRRRQLAHRQQRQHGHRPGRRAAHAAAARVRLRHHRQRRHRVAAARGEGGARRRHQGAEAHHRAEGAQQDRAARPSGGRRSSTASPASPPRTAAPPSAPSAASPTTRSRSPPRPAPPRCAGPARSNKAPTAVFGAYGPATDAQFAISVLLEEAGYGGSVAAPVARRLFDVLRDPCLAAARARGRPVRGARHPRPHHRGRARLMAATTLLDPRAGRTRRARPPVAQPGRAVAPHRPRAGRLHRRRRRARLADDLQRHPRARPVRLRHRASWSSRCCSSASAPALMFVVALVDYRRYREAVPGPLRRRAARCC